MTAGRRNDKGYDPMGKPTGPVAGTVEIEVENGSHNPLWVVLVPAGQSYRAAGAERIAVPPQSPGSSGTAQLRLDVGDQIAYGDRDDDLIDLINFHGSMLSWTSPPTRTHMPCGFQATLKPDLSWSLATNWRNGQAPSSGSTSYACQTLDNDRTRLALYCNELGILAEFEFQPQARLGVVKVTDTSSSAEIMTVYPVVRAAQPVTLSLAPRRQTVAERRNFGLAIVPNYTANTKGFDPLHLDLREGPTGHGIKANVFADLHESDTDFEVQTNYLVKQGLTISAVTMGKFVRRMQMTYTAREHLDSFSVGVTVGAEDDNTLAGSLSVGYQKTQAETLEESSYFAVSHAKGTLYSIETDPVRHALHPDFVAALQTLPDPQFFLDKLNNPQAFDRFLDRFGTHYAKRVAYGGMMYAETRIDTKRHAKFVEEGWSVDVAAKATGTKIPLGVQVNVDHTVQDLSTNQEETSKEVAERVGGDGTTVEGFSLDARTVEAVEIDLRPITEVLSQQKLRTRRPISHLDRKRKALELLLADRFVGIDVFDGEPVDVWEVEVLGFTWHDKREHERGYRWFRASLNISRPRDFTDDYTPEYEHADEHSLKDPALNRIHNKYDDDKSKADGNRPGYVWNTAWSRQNVFMEEGGWFAADDGRGADRYYGQRQARLAAPKTGPRPGNFVLTFAVWRTNGNQASVFNKAQSIPIPAAAEGWENKTMSLDGAYEHTADIKYRVRKLTQWDIPPDMNAYLRRLAFERRPT